MSQRYAQSLKAGKVLARLPFGLDDQSEFGLWFGSQSFQQLCINFLHYSPQ